MKRLFEFFNSEVLRRPCGVDSHMESGFEIQRHAAVARVSPWLRVSRGGGADTAVEDSSSQIFLVDNVSN